MLVEFIGPAGAGKSFLAERVLERLSVRGICSGNFDLYQIKKTRARNILLVAKAFYAAGRLRPKPWLRLPRSGGMIARYWIRREICDQLEGVHVTSEGIFHRMITLYRQSGMTDMHRLAQILLQGIRPPEIVVVVEASAERIWSRRVSRNRPDDQFTPESIAQDIAMVGAAVVVVQDVKSAFSPALGILRVDANEDGGKSAVTEIVTAIEHRLAAEGIQADVPRFTGFE